MVALICLCLNLVASLFKSKSRRNWNSVPVLIEGKAGGFATSEEFLCHV
jgi:hypothetical protein